MGLDALKVKTEEKDAKGSVSWINFFDFSDFYVHFGGGIEYTSIKILCYHTESASLWGVETLKIGNHIGQLQQCNATKINTKYNTTNQ